MLIAAAFIQISACCSVVAHAGGVSGVADRADHFPVPELCRSCWRRHHRRLGITFLLLIDGLMCKWDVTFYHVNWSFSSIADLPGWGIRCLTDDEVAVSKLLSAQRFPDFFAQTSARQFVCLEKLPCFSFVLRAIFHRKSPDLTSFLITVIYQMQQHIIQSHLEYLLVWKFICTCGLKRSFHP